MVKLTLITKPDIVHMFIIVLWFALMVQKSPGIFVTFVNLSLSIASSLFILCLNQLIFG